MSQKQNNKFVLGKLYPQYFRPQKLSEIKEQKQAPKLSRSSEEKKIQTRLKSIIYNLERQIQEQTLLTSQRNQTNSSKASIRSFSQKQLGGRSRSQRYRTEAEETDVTDELDMSRKHRKHSQYHKPSQALILPKLKLHNKIIGEDHRNQLLIKKKNKKLERLEEQDHQLGKIVLEKVQQHFQMEKAGRKHHYFERVKSEQGIDDSFVTYLRNRVKKANVALER